MPSFVFRIDEIKESPDENRATLVDGYGNWMPSAEPDTNVRVGGGVSGNYYLCDGQKITLLRGFPQGAVLYKTHSMYFVGGGGFWVLKGDATSPPRDGETWQPLRFDWDRNNYSSYLTNAGENPTLRIQRDDQSWARLLLPDIYHAAQPRTPYTEYGWLKGELPIFLALLAFSVSSAWLPNVLPTMFQNSSWRVHPYDHGRTHQRGVVVYVYMLPQSSSNGSTREDLQNLENGEYGYYYY